MASYNNLFYPKYLNNTEQHASKLITAYRKDGRVYSPEIARRENVDAYWYINADPSIRHSIEVMARNIVGRTYKIEAASSEKIDRELNGIIKEQVEETRYFSRSRMAMAKEVSILGESYAFVNGHRKEMDLGRKGKQAYWCPTEIIHIDNSRIRKIVNEDGIGYHYLLFDIVERTWKEMRPDQYQALLYINNSSEEGRFTAGNGLLDPLYIIHTFKQNLVSEMLSAGERFGQGLTTLQIDDQAEGDEDLTLADLNSTYADLLADIKARHSFIYRKSDELKIHEPSGQGHQILMDGINYFDGLHRMLCIGSLLTVSQGSQGTGSYSLGQVHQDTEFNHARYPRSLIDECLSQQFIKLIHNLNKPQYQAIGLGEARPGRFFTPEDRDDDLQANAARLTSAQSLGLPLVREEMYRLLQLTEPVEGDVVVQPPVENIGYPVDPYDAPERLFESGEKTFQPDEKVLEEKERRKEEKDEEQQEKIQLDLQRKKLGLEGGNATEEEPEDIVQNAQRFAEKTEKAFKKVPCREREILAYHAMRFAKKMESLSK